MTAYSLWRDLIKPTLFAYVIVCAILAEIAGAYYLYVNSPIMLDLFASTQPHYATQTQQTSRMYNNEMKNYPRELLNKLCNYLNVEIGELLED